MGMLSETVSENDESKRLGSLVQSFIRFLIAYQTIQVAIFLAYSIPMRFFSSYIVDFLFSSIGFHVFIFMLLFVFRGDFVIEPSGRKLERVNKANAITLFRLSTLPTILFIILASKDYPMRYQLVALVAIVFATDFLDGYISRRDKETTRVGRMMDSASDYSLLFVISIVFYYFKIIPGWFLALLVTRLAGQAVMLLAVLVVKKRITPKTSFLGKATVASTMVLYAFELLRFVADIPPAAFRVFEAVVGLVIMVSIIDKVIMMAHDLGSTDRANSKTGRLNPIMNGDTDGSDKERA